MRWRWVESFKFQKICESVGLTPFSFHGSRPEHAGILADVLSVDAKGIVVQFEDRADTTRIAFSDRAWMDFIELTSEELNFLSLEMR